MNIGNVVGGILGFLVGIIFITSPVFKLEYHTFVAVVLTVIGVAVGGIVQDKLKHKKTY